LDETEEMVEDERQFDDTERTDRRRWTWPAAARCSCMRSLLIELSALLVVAELLALHPFFENYTTRIEAATAMPPGMGLRD
jgi:hypothetical protein